MQGKNWNPNQSQNQNSDWNRFAATGKIMDYLDYRACVGEGASQSRWKREDTEDGTDHSAERYRSVSNAYRGL